MISDKQARRRGYKFNFSEDEWKSIAESVRGLPQPYHYDWLLEFANLYLVYREFPTRQLSRSQRSAGWARVARLAKCLRHALEKVDDPIESLIRINLVPAFKNWRPARRESSRPRNFGSYRSKDRLAVLELLRRLEGTAAIGSELFDTFLARGPDEFDILNCHGSRMAYLTAIFELWTRAGGALRFSRHATTGAPRGPTVRYVQAVTRPLMPDYFPTPEGICDLIKREKKLRDLDPQRIDAWTQTQGPDGLTPAERYAESLMAELETPEASKPH